MKKIAILFLALYSALYSVSICSSRDFVHSLKSGILRSGADGYCQGNTFYIVAQIYSQSDFDTLRQNLHNVSDLLASGCSLFDEALRVVNHLNNINLRGNLVYVYEYNGQRLRYTCP